MKPEIKSKWLEALRSGEYLQCGSVLHKEETNQFCCLGVLCDVYIKETGLGVWKGSYFEGDQTSSTFVLPHEVAEWAGLPSHSPIVDTDSGVEGLTTLNDMGTTFVAIADIIEKTERFD